MSKPESMFDLKSRVEFIYGDIIDQFNLSLVSSSENSLVLNSGSLDLVINSQMGELDMSILVNGYSRPINPLLWGYIIKGIDYRDVIPVRADPSMKLVEHVTLRLNEEKTYLALFCKDLLSHDFSQVSLYFDKLHDFMIEFNSYHEMRRQSEGN